MGVYAQEVNSEKMQLYKNSANSVFEQNNVPYNNKEVILKGTMDDYFTFHSNWGLAGEANALEVINGIAYWGNGTVLRIMDQSDPVNPVEMGYVNIEGEIKDIEKRDNYAYVSTGMAELFIVDVSDLNNPEVVGSVQVPFGYGWVLGLEVYNGYAYFCTRDGTAIIDVTEPTNPVIVNTDIIPLARDPHAVDGYLYVPVASAGLDLHVFDLTDPGQPVLAGNFWDGGMIQAFNVFVEGDYLYYVKPYAGFGIVNISDLNNIFLVGGAMGTGDSYIYDVEVKDGFAYVCNCDGLDIFDVTDPSATSLIDHIELGWLYSTEIEIYNDYVFYAHAAGLHTFQLTAPGNAELIKSMSAGGYVVRIATKDNHVFAPAGAWAEGGFYSINVEDPENPVASDFIEVDGTFDIEVKGNYAYLTRYTWLDVVDISDPDNLTVVASYTINAAGLEVFELVISGNHLFIVDWDGFHIYEILDNGELDYVSYFYAGIMYVANGLAVQGDYVYMSCNGPSVDAGAIMIVDISDLTNPQETAYYLVNDYLHTIAVKDNYVYTGGRQDFIMVIDVSDPYNPQTVNYEMIGDDAYIWSVRVIEQTLFITNGICRAYTIDGDDLDEAGYFAPYSYHAMETIKGEGNMLYIADATGISIVEYDFTVQIADNPENNSDCYNFPNPFNGHTTITFKNTNGGMVNLTIFNLTSQEVITVIDGVLPPGVYNKEINTKNLKPGIYYYNLTTSQGIQSKKMIKVN